MKLGLNASSTGAVESLRKQWRCCARMALDPALLHDALSDHGLRAVVEMNCRHMRSGDTTRHC